MLIQITNIQGLQIKKLVITSEQFGEKLGINTASPFFPKQLYIQTLKRLATANILDVWETKDTQFFLKENEAPIYLTKHMSGKQIMDSCDISPQTLRKLCKTYDIPLHKFNTIYKDTFIPLEFIEKYIMNDKYITGYALLKISSLDKKSKKNFPRRALLSVINNIQKQKLNDLLGYKELTIPLYFKNTSQPQKHVFLREKVIRFFDQYVSINKVLNELSMRRSNLVTLLHNINIKIYTLYGSSHDGKFISKNDYHYLQTYRKAITRGGSGIYAQHNDKYIEYREKYYTKRQVINYLSLNSDQIDIVLNDYDIQPVEVLEYNFKNSKTSLIYFFSKNEIHKLIDKQALLKQQYQQEYYTIQEIKSLMNKDGSTSNFLYSYIPKNNIQSTECPALLMGVLERYNGSKNLFRKEDVHQYLLDRKNNKNLIAIEMEDPFNEFIYKTEQILQISFSTQLAKTKDLWFQYVRKQLHTTKNSNISIYINQLSKTSFYLADLLTKEIYSYPSFSLNKLFFEEKSNMPRTYQRILYHFCKEVYVSIYELTQKAPYTLEKLTNPNQFLNQRNVDLSRYTYEEYKDLYKFVNDLSIHKLTAIQDVESLLQENTYHNYDSYWLYILIQLTNSWRHSTVITQIPEIDLSNTSITDLDWLKQNNPSLEDANSIIFQIGRYVKKIHKTGADSIFRISDPLKIAFATAISICQLRVNAYHLVTPSSNKKNIAHKNIPNDVGALIWLKTRYVVQPKHTTHKNFFKNFKHGFKFSNRKMNRTLITLIWSVLRSLNAAKVSRSHYDENSTMCYIKLDDKQLTHLVEQIFERSSFGYITQLLTNKLFNGLNIEKNVETQKMLELTKRFGDVQKIEFSSGLIDRLATERWEVIDLINGFKKEEIQHLLSQATTNTLYSKQKYYQCVFSQCKYDDITNNRDCTCCSFSIINVYALSNLMATYLKGIYHIISNFNNAKEGEKKKMANHFYLLWLQVQSAKEQFGDLIYDFVEGGKERFSLLSKQLPKTKKYLTEGIYYIQSHSGGEFPC
ncbi:hypothetical protein BK709_01030 [Bacillus thuringiensis serovar shandongiensis]|uniref:hypothetical protein n=1 Tax=Bacillus toyonensis TaxID=155322 RepID=UPI000B44410D|nr:hypothetical protein [Bacillus toyonensis]MEC2390015.1 hypothetical protein [Bacillus toyonensis]OTX31461.1 hypothetical protein BK717_22985 [Bacillus thuringiensis serovar malayensis]OUB11455.1 hypothetical protein BK709_01030 [Bacillus thuringiensis serovar shandongiensis]